MGISALITRGIHNKSLRKPKREEIRDVVSAEEWEEPQVESSTRATQNRSTGSKWLDKILNWDQTHIKAIMLKKRGIAKWSDGAWRTKNGADVTMWLETKAKKKWLQMKWYHWETFPTHFFLKGNVDRPKSEEDEQLPCKTMKETGEVSEREPKKFDKLARLLWKASWSFRSSLIDMVLPDFYKIERQRWMTIWDDLKQIRRHRRTSEEKKSTKATVRHDLWQYLRQHDE